MWQPTLHVRAQSVLENHLAAPVRKLIYKRFILLVIILIVIMLKYALLFLD